MKCKKKVFYVIIGFCSFVFKFKNVLKKFFGQFLIILGLEY